MTFRVSVEDYADLVDKVDAALADFRSIREALDLFDQVVQLGHEVGYDPTRSALAHGILRKIRDIVG